MHRTRVAGLVVASLIAAGVLWYALRDAGLAPRSVASAAASGVATSTSVTSTPIVTASGGPAASASVAAGASRRPTAEDRQRRDEMRRRIYAAFGEAPPAKQAASARPPAPLPEEPKKAKGRLDKDYIQKRIRKDFFPLARECYEAALERDPTMGGKLKLNFEIVGDESVGGIVESVELADDNEMVEEEFVYCVRESMLSMTFEPPKGGGSVTVTYPFLFSNDDSEED